MSGQIFNVTESTHPSEFQTSAAQAQADAKTAPLARQVEANADQAQSAATDAAYVALAKGPQLTGQSATDRLQTDASVKTGAAVDQGKQDLAAAQAAGAGYVEQAKNLASNAVASAQSYIPPGSGPDGAHTAGDVVASVKAGATAGVTAVVETTSYAIAAAQPYVKSAADAAQPHVTKAKDAVTNYVSGMTGTTTTQTAPVQGENVQV